MARKKAPLSSRGGGKHMRAAERSLQKERRIPNLQLSKGRGLVHPDPCSVIDPATATDCGPPCTSSRPLKTCPKQPAAIPVPLAEWSI
ncbi:predicted protein [Chaetomium globosum CBS 148.51]|uniref:Uncharacterized protein n=1 Tax=Chaetomium globosum (strain ATCC 6205 / CBS 148.51 / DSM 1962 / NBRC 6347 / NRRL 1970) TaxID=306901 RepID=Q2GTP4_CHAGB|nr:uncharacterized protein CHGG_08660 [Chaetomium globosum CBS 148.51]EAQ84646.1 predicted protein [Chaetomium globosum CBS 148.51]